MNCTLFTQVHSDVIAARNVCCYNADSRFIPYHLLAANDVITVTGTAFIINADGYLLTCAHVVKDAKQITVGLNDREYEAVILGIDNIHDIALLQVLGKFTGINSASSGKLKSAGTLGRKSELPVFL